MSIRSRRRWKNPDANKLIIYHNPTGAATFDPTITLSQAGTVIWETEVDRIITTGTTHNLSYTPTAGAKICKITVAGGLGLVTAIDTSLDVVTSTKNVYRMSNLVTMNLGNNTSLQFLLSLVPSKVINLYLNFGGVTGSLAMIGGRKFLYLHLVGSGAITGQLSDIYDVEAAICYSATGLMAASIAGWASAKDIRIYYMGWSATQNTTVLLSAWNARAGYTYASGIQLRISAPTGTPGTEPPAVGESNSDWGWNAETNRHDPLTGYAAMSDLQNDFYSEGFKGWAITIV